MQPDGRPSRTAARVALRRAAHQVMDRPLVFEDPLALKMIRWDAAQILRTRPEQFERGRYSTFMRAFLVVRSRMAEDLIADEIARGTRQVVILGAGLDTYAYRQRHTDVRVIEVDHPATQQWKRKRLAESHIDIPPNVTYAPIDFERQALADVLAASGLDAAQPAVCSWLGVTPYLDAAAIWQTLADVARFTATGGGVVFDYSMPPSTLSWAGQFYYWIMRRKLAKIGEPFKTYFDPPMLAAKLREIGFDTIEDLGGDAINAQYFAGRSDGLRVGSIGRILTARRTHCRP